MALPILSAREGLWSFEQKGTGSCKTETADCTNEPNSLESDATPFHFMVICWSQGNLSLINFLSFKRILCSRKNLGLWKSRYNQRGCLWCEAVVLVGKAGRKSSRDAVPHFDSGFTLFEDRMREDNRNIRISVVDVCWFYWVWGKKNKSCVYPPPHLPS